MLRPSFQPARVSVRFRLAAWAAVAAVVAVATAVPAAAASPSFTAFDARARAGDRLTVLVLGQAVPFWPRGWIKFQWAPAFLIVLRIALTGK